MGVFPSRTPSLQVRSEVSLLDSTTSPARAIKAAFANEAKPFHTTDQPARAAYNRLYRPI
jgi:hypothetical protein